VTVPLTMLDPRKIYTATVYRDGEEADWQTNPYDYLIETILVQSSDTLHLPMASGGGFAIAIQ
jgi:alpha-glucosidase